MQNRTRNANFSVAKTVTVVASIFSGVTSVKGLQKHWKHKYIGTNIL